MDMGKFQGVMAAVTLRQGNPNIHQGTLSSIARRHDVAGLLRLWFAVFVELHLQFSLHSPIYHLHQWIVLIITQTDCRQRLVVDLVSMRQAVVHTRRAV